MTNPSRLLCLAALLLGLARTGLAQQPALPPGYPPGLYDEAQVPAYTLPDALVTQEGERVASVETWRQVRRPEILQLFETHVYGRTVVGRPEGMAWEVVEEARTDSMLRKTVAIRFSSTPEGPGMRLQLTLPPDADAPVPLFLMPGRMPTPKLLLDRGYGVATFDPREIEPDRRDSSYEASIRKFFAPPGQTEPRPDEWGALGAWAWAMSRAMDYLETDPHVDAGRVALFGFSRYGKVAMWAGAQDERFALVVSGQSGLGGVVLARRGFGETIASANGYAPHWFAENFKGYNDRPADLPVDWHLLVALMAPRPVLVATASEDYWGDPRGSFLSALHAGPVYRLYGMEGLGAEEMPPVETLVGDRIGYYMRQGGHGLSASDWTHFLDFADRHFGR